MARNDAWGPARRQSPAAGDFDAELSAQPMAQAVYRHVVADGHAVPAVVHRPVAEGLWQPFIHSLSGRLDIQRRDEDLRPWPHPWRSSAGHRG